MNANSSKPRQRVRIIGGEWRSRVLGFANIADIRPTPDRVRETLFNWLQGPIIGARCLDLFAGSGALGLEALSRGASSVTALELDSKAANAIRDNCRMLNTARLQLVQRNALDWLQHNSEAQQFDVIFLDPPFAGRLYEPCGRLLQEQQWLAAGALIYVEAEQSLELLGLPATWQLLRAKRAASVHFGLFKA